MIASLNGSLVQKVINYLFFFTFICQYEHCFMIEDIVAVFKEV